MNNKATTRHQGVDHPHGGSLLTTAEVAEITRLAIRTLEEMRSNREGPRYLKLGRKVVYRRADVEEWLRACERGGDHV